MPILANKQNMIRTTPSPDTWVRPTDWPELPTVTSADTKITGVYAVYETRKNISTLGIGNGTSPNITISWGDGTSNTTLSSVSQTNHTYTYSAITGTTIMTDIYGEKYKPVLVTVTYNSGTMTLFNFGSSTSTGTTNWLDVVMSWGTAAVTFPKGAPLLQRFKMLSGTFTSVNINSIFNNLSSCRVFELPTNIGNPTQMASTFGFLGNCEIGDFTVGGAISISTAFGNSLIRKFGNLTATGVTAGNSVFSSCPNLREIGNVNIPATTTLANFFLYCQSLYKTGTITSTSATTISQMFYFCPMLRETAFTSLSAVTTTSNAFYACYSLESLRVPGLKVSFTLVDCALERPALVQVFNDLGTPATTQTITITRNPGVSDLTAADILIATSKNWTVTL